MVMARWQATITDEAGNVLPAAEITVRRETGGATLAAVYSDRDGVTPLGNPFAADADGFAAFHVAGGAYRIDAVSGALTRTWRYVGIGLGSESDLTGFVTSPASYSNIQNVSATSRVLGRRTAGAGVIEECTLSQVLDMVGGAAQGGILYRGSSAWAMLGAGTAGQVLRTGGASADPIWGGSLVLLASGTPSNVASIDLVLTSFTQYRGFKIFGDLRPATDNVAMTMRFSTNGGSSYDAGASDYAYVEQFSTSGSSPGNNGVSSDIDEAFIRITGSLGNQADEGACFEMTILNPFATTRRTRMFGKTAQKAFDDSFVFSTVSGIRNATQDTDAIRLSFSSGNINSGMYTLYGIM